LNSPERLQFWQIAQSSLNRLILEPGREARRCGAVVENDFYNKLERLNVQTVKTDKIGSAHV